MSRVLLAAAPLLLACAAARLPQEPVLKDYALAQKVFPLKSGLRVLVQEQRGAPIVTVAAVYGVGSTSDPKGAEGLAHLVEHLAFRTRPGGGQEQLWDKLKRLGAAPFNASTSPDFTTYYEVVHKDRLHETLQLEAWRLARTLDGVTPEVFATEREVVRNELRQRSETTIGSRTFDLLLRALFPAGHPLSRPIGGTHESLSATTLAHAQAFVRDHYRPDNCTVVVAGDVDAGEVGRLIGTWPSELLFGPGGQDGPAAPPRARVAERAPPPLPPPVSTALVRHKGPVPQPQLVLAWSAPPGYRDSDALLRFVGARLGLALGEGVTVKEDDDLEGFGVGVVPTASASLLLVQANLKPGADPEKARARILDALVKTWTTELGPLQTEATRWSAATALLHATGEPVFAATRLAEHFAATGKTAFFSDSLLDLARVEAGQVLDVAHRHLTRARAVAVYFEPESDEAPRLVAGGGGPASAGGVGRADHRLGGDSATSAADFGPARILEVARPPGLGRLPRWKLPSGLEVVAVKHGAAPVAEILVGVRGGDALSRPPGLASFASSFSRSRCRDHGSLAPVGGRLAIGVGATRGSASVAVLSGNLENGLAVLADRLACLEVSEEAFLGRDRLLELRGRSYQRALKRPDFVAQQKLWAALYPNHPYGNPIVDPATLKTISYEDASALLRVLWRPGQAIAVVGGDVEIARVRAMADAHLARWQGGAGTGAAMVPAPPELPDRRRAFLVDRPDATQVAVRVGCRLADGRPETLPAYDVAEALAGELAWMLRERWGATYGVHPEMDIFPGGAAHLVLAGAVESAQAGPAVARLLDLIADMAAGRVDESLFLTKRWDVARKYAQRFSTVGAIGAAVLAAADRGWPADVWDRYPERLAHTTRQSVREIMKTCAGREIVTVVGSAARLRAQMEAAGIPLEAEPPAPGPLAREAAR